MSADPRNLFLVSEEPSYNTGEGSHRATDELLGKAAAVYHSNEQSDEQSDEDYFASLHRDKDDNHRKKVQENAAWWASILTSLKLGFLVSLFNFFRTSGLKNTFQTTAWHFAMLPIAVAFESIEVITDIIQIIAAKKSTPQQWVSLVVNILRLAGVGLAVGLILSGLAATGAVFATIAGAAFVFAVGVKTLWHIGSAIYSGVKSLNPTLSPTEKSDLRHDALNHTVGAGIAAALTVCIGFVMLKASFLFAAIGMGVSGFGAIAGLGIMVKDYHRKKKVEEAHASIAKSDLDESLLGKDYTQEPSPHKDPRFQSSYRSSETRSEQRMCSNPCSTLFKYISSLSIFNTKSNNDYAKYKKTDGDIHNEESKEIVSQPVGVRKYSHNRW